MKPRGLGGRTSLCKVSMTLQLTTVTCSRPNEPCSTRSWRVRGCLSRKGSHHLKPSARYWRRSHEPFLRTFRSKRAFRSRLEHTHFGVNRRHLGLELGRAEL